MQKGALTQWTPATLRFPLWGSSLATHCWQEERISKALPRCAGCWIPKRDGKELTVGPQSLVQPSLMGISTTVTFGASLRYSRATSTDYGKRRVSASVD